MTSRACLRPACSLAPPRYRELGLGVLAHHRRRQQFLFDTECDQLLMLDREHQFARFAARGHPAARHAIAGAAALEQTLVQCRRKGLGAIGPAGREAKNLEIAKPHGFFTDVRGNWRLEDSRAMNAVHLRLARALRSAVPERLHPFYCPLLRRGNLLAAHQRFRVF
jgi:hypothetical protein